MVSELPGTSAVGIESVEWLDAGGGHLTVRITGRWRRRRLVAGGPTALVVESDGQRHRFAALPEPPSLAGTPPGMWRLSFSVPGSLAPGLGGRTWLAFGTVTVPLPVPESAGASPPPSPRGASPPTPSPPTPSASAPRGAVASEPDARELREAEDATAETGRLRQERALRERRAGGRRRVLVEPTRIAEAAPGGELGELGELAQPAPPAATPGEETERPLAAGLLDSLRRELDARAAAEAGLRARMVDAETRLAARVLLDQRATATLGQLRAELEDLREAAERERSRAEAAEGRAADLADELERQRERSRDAHDSIRELREAVDELRSRSPAEPVDAESSRGEAAEETAAGESSPGDAGPITPDRFSDALTRLRASTEPRDAPPVAPTPRPVIGGQPAPPPTTGRPTLEDPVRRLARRDADTAGRLVLDLLALQHRAYPHPVAYDLVMGPGRGCVRVTVGAGEAVPEIELGGAARAHEEVNFQVLGDPSRLARLLTARGLRRRLRWRQARIRPARQRREALAAVQSLLGLPLDLAGLHAEGMRTEPERLLALVAAIVEPAWTRGERFSLAYVGADSPAVYVAVRDGKRIAVTRTAPEGRVATEIHGSPDDLVALLTGPAPGADVRGDHGPLDLLRGWVKRAQSG